MNDQELIAEAREFAAADKALGDSFSADRLTRLADALEAANRREAELQGPLNHRLLANLDVITMQEHGLRLDEQATREADWRASLVTEHLESEAALEAVIAKVAAMTTSNAQVREGHVCVEVGYITRVLIDAPHAALDVLIADAKAEERTQIVTSVRQNCTPSQEAYQAGGDHLIRAVTDWIENPPEWVQEQQRRRDELRKGGE